MLKRTREEAGFTLIELMVVLVLLGVVSSIVLNATIQGLNASRLTQERVLALSDLTKGLERIGRELRAADPLDLSQVPDVASAPFEVGSTVVRDGKVLKFRYYLPAGSTELREDVKVFQLDGITPIPTEDRAGLFIVNTVNVALGIPLLTYFDNQGVAMDCTALTLPECRAYLATAEQVRLTLVRSLPEQQPVRVESFINIRQARFT